MRPEITIVRRVSTKSQNDHCEAMCEGLKTIGIPFVYNKTLSMPIKTKKLSMWGWKVGSELRAKGHDILVMEHAYIGDRKHYTSLGWNGLNGHAQFPEYPDDGGKRFQEIGGVINPWRENPNGYVLILGQLKGDASLYGFDAETGYNKWVRELLKRGERVLFRHHPESIKHKRQWDIKGAEISQGSLQEALDGCKYAIVYNSNSAVDAILNGTPCVAMDKGSMVYELCGKGIGDIIRPDREKVLNQVAHSQWTLSEIATGEPLKKLFEVEL